MKSQQSLGIETWLETTLLCYWATTTGHPPAFRALYRCYTGSTEWLGCTSVATQHALSEGGVLACTYCTWGIWHALLYMILACRNWSFTFSSSAILLSSASLRHLSASHALLHSSVSFANVSICQSRTNIQVSRQFTSSLILRCCLPCKLSGNKRVSMDSWKTQPNWIVSVVILRTFYLSQVLSNQWTFSKTTKMYAWLVSLKIG